MHAEGTRQVWIVNHHATLPSKDGRSGRHLSLARHLPANGWSASLLVASTSHPSGSQKLHGARLRKLTSEENVPTLWVRTSAYGSSMPRRFVGMLVFAALLLLPGMTKGLPRPDVIVGSTVHPFAAWAASRLAKRFKVPFVYEVRDVWPETLVDFGKLGRDSALSRLLGAISRRLYGDAAHVVSPLQRLDIHMSESGFRDVPFTWISNGVEPSETIPKPCQPSEAFTFMYLGSHGHANHLEDLLRAFDDACLGSPVPLHLRLIGDGPLKGSLRGIARTLRSSDHISFEDPIPRSDVISRAGEADCLVAVIGDYDVYSYGISLNKLFDYLQAARPVVLATDVTDNPVSESSCGIVVPSADREALTRALIDIPARPIHERQQMGARGAHHVVTNYSYEGLAAKLARALNSAAARKADD